MIKMQAKKIETMRREFQNRAVRAEPCGDCPDAEAIWDAAAGELPVEERRNVVSHLCSCAECAHAWRLAWAMQTEMRHDESRNTYATVVWNQWKRFAPQVAAAAMLVLALGVGVMLHRPAPEPSTPVHRGATVEHPIQSLIPEGKALPREEFVLRWTGVGEEALYDVEVMTSDLALLDHVEDLETTRYQVRPELLEGFDGERNVLWRVTARLPDGSVKVADRTFVTQVQ